MRWHENLIPWPAFTYRAVSSMATVCYASIKGRVASFGDFSPIGRLFTLGGFIVTAVAQMLGLSLCTYMQGKIPCINF
jgi:hypothetical protein